MIPRLIHLIWLGPPVPGDVVSFVEKCRALHPGFEVKLWGDDDVAGLECHELVKREPRMSGKADIVRYELLLRFGGIYLDCDMTVLRSLDVVLSLGSDVGVVVCRESRSTFNNAFMAAAPSHPLLHRLVSGLSRTIDEFLEFSSPLRTGPRYLTRNVLDFVASGGSVVELPQHWVYPYSHDRPELRHRAVSSESLMRHEWATYSGQWSSGPKRVHVARAVGVVRTFVSPSGWKARLERRPEAHAIRDRYHGRMAALAGGWPQRRVQPLPSREPVAPQTLADLPNAVRVGLNRAVRRQMKGPATFVGIGTEAVEAWRFASARLGRSGRALQCVPVSIKDSALFGMDGGTRCRGSQILLTAGSEGCDTGELIISRGVPLVPRRLDRSRSLDEWDEHAVLWKQWEILEGCPHIDVLVVGADVSIATIRAQLVKMVEMERIEHLIFIVNPNSTRQNLSELAVTIHDLKVDGEQIEAFGTIRKQGSNAWQVQIRGAQEMFGISVSCKGSEVVRGV